MGAVRDASRLARPMNTIGIRLKCKHFIQNSDHVHGVLNSYIISYNSAGSRKKSGSEIKKD